jgi:TDP-D-fucosamine acetyltransferase
MLRILDWCAREAIDCLYLLAATNDMETIRAAEDQQFRLVDIRATFDRTLAEEFGPTTHVRQACEQDVPALAEIARVSHTDSRFYHDPGFQVETCNRFYATWIENSLHGYAQSVLVAERNSKPLGYVSCHWSDGVGRIGLIAVAASARRTGIGLDLVRASLRTFRDHGATYATVVTQGSNIASQRLYQRSGFVTRSVELWYHRWFTRK